MSDTSQSLAPFVRSVNRPYKDWPASFSPSLARAGIEPQLVASSHSPGAWLDGVASPMDPGQDQTCLPIAPTRPAALWMSLRDPKILTASPSPQLRGHGGGVLTVLIVVVIVIVILVSEGISL